MSAHPWEAPIYHSMLKHSRCAAKLRAEVTPRPAWETSCAQSTRHLERNKVSEALAVWPGPRFVRMIWEVVEDQSFWDVAKNPRPRKIIAQVGRQR